MKTAERTQMDIFLVDDNPFMRKAMRQLIELEPEFKVCGEAATAEDALKALSNKKPDIALIDISLGGDEKGIQLIRDIREVGYHFPILTISLHEEALYADRVLQAGAQGYLMKQDAPENLVDAIQRITAGSKGSFYRGAGGN